MKNLLLKVIVILSVLIGFSSFASASEMDMCKVIDLQVGDKIDLYLNTVEGKKHITTYTITDRKKHPTKEVDDLIIMKGYKLSVLKTTLFERVWCQKNVMMINFFASLKNGVRKTHDMNMRLHYEYGRWVYQKDKRAELVITKKTSLTSN